MSILCVSCCIILRIVQQLDKVGASTPVLHSLSITRGNAELLLSLLANTTAELLLSLLANTTLLFFPKRVLC